MYSNKKEQSEKDTSSDGSKVVSKRVDIVSIKLVREASVLYKNRAVKCPADAVELAKEFLQDSDREEMIVVCLNIKNQPTLISRVSMGSLNSSICSPREVFKIAVLGNSAAILLFHNHPSGDPQPSSEDISITNRLAEAGKIIGIEVLDHIIIGGDSYVSLKEKAVL